jgi:hypothetical protein
MSLKLDSVVVVCMIDHVVRGDFLLALVLCVLIFVIILVIEV